MTRPLTGRSLALGPGPEFDRIRGITQLLGEQGAGLGDDCGLIRADDGYIALSTDVSVEEVHFRLDWISLAEMGWRSTAAALSDLGAEGADPAGALCAITVPAPAGEPELLEAMSGVGAVARAFEFPILGGDLSSGPVWSLAVTVVGRTPTPVTRGGARPGDNLWVTGVLGGARTALEMWGRQEQPPAAARSRYARPEPRIAAGRWLARHGAHAMIDLSDGLGSDARHLAAASGVAVELYLDAIPLGPGVEAEAGRQGVPAQQFAAEAGEDFELLVALPPEFNRAEAFQQECGIGLTRIGAVAQGRGVRFLLGNRPMILKGFNHFG